MGCVEIAPSTVMMRTCHNYVASYVIIVGRCGAVKGMNLPKMEELILPVPSTRNIRNTTPPAMFEVTD